MKSILSISSHIVVGRVGQSATSFAFQRLGCDVWALPSVLYAATPSGGKAFGASLPPDIFERLLAGLSSERLASLAAVHIGYLRDADQVTATARLIARVRAMVPRAPILLDPILGDEPGGLYVPAETAEAIKAGLIGAADILTPNLFELGFLSGRQVNTKRAAIEAARSLGPAMVVVTSAPSDIAEESSTWLVEPGKAWRLRTPLHASAPHGTGDLLAALFLARLLGGEAAPSALSKSVASVHDLIAAAEAEELDHLPIVEHQERLVEPRASVTLEALGVS